MSDQHKKEISPARLFAMGSFLIAVLLCYGIVLYNTQIVHGAEYLEQSVRTITSQEIVEASRGIVTDRNGKVLVSNRQTYNLTFDPSLLSDTDDKNASILRLIQLCRDKGFSWTDGLPVSSAQPWTYTLSDAGTTQQSRFVRFLKDLKLVSGDATIEMVTESMEHRESLLKGALAQIAEDYDFILIDCPPSLELLTLNALCAADSILVPVQGEYYALEGLSDLMNTVRIVRRSLNPQLQLEGVLLTMFDGRTNLALQVAEEVKHYFPGKVYSTVIPRNVRLSEAPSHGKPIFSYDRSSRGAEAYAAFAQEFIKKSSVR